MILFVTYFGKEIRETDIHREKEKEREIDR